MPSPVPDEPYPMPTPVHGELSASKVCERTCFDGPTECQAGWASEQIGVSSFLPLWDG